jgi:hypothetical protein
MKYFSINCLSVPRTSKGLFSLGLSLKIFYVFITSVKIVLSPPLMPILTKVYVVYVFYVEQSYVDFGYIQTFPSGVWP